MEVNRWTLSDYLQIGFGGFPFGGLMSIDVTYRCPVWVHPTCLFLDFLQKRMADSGLC